MPQTLLIDVGTWGALRLHSLDLDLIRRSAVVGAGFAGLWMKTTETSEIVFRVSREGSHPTSRREFSQANSSWSSRAGGGGVAGLAGDSAHAN